MSPWTVDRWSDKQGSKGISIKDGDGLCIANMVGQLDDSELKKAHEIVRSVNCHEELLAALRGLVGAHQTTPGPRGVLLDVPHFIKKATAAITHAESR
jgi:hypothetical protein